MTLTCHVRQMPAVGKFGCIRKSCCTVQYAAQLMEASDMLPCRNALDEIPGRMPESLCTLLHSVEGVLQPSCKSRTMDAMICPKGMRRGNITCARWRPKGGLWFTDSMGRRFGHGELLVWRNVGAMQPSDLAIPDQTCQIHVGLLLTCKCTQTRCLLCLPSGLCTGWVK